MAKKERLNFIEQIIKGDLAKGKHETIKTRFPPEPNGYLHIGHAKSIVLNFSVAEKFGGTTNLRFDDTNPVTEETEYVEAIKKDIKWLGYTWDGDVKYTSDYFDDLFAFAVKLIIADLAYVEDFSAEEILEFKGNVNSPGTNSPCRSRSVEENLELFDKMREGVFEEGEKVLRAKIDMAHPNMHLRDPVIYRIKKATHHRTGDKWCIYPMYDFAHGQSDSIENITHSLCTLEFENHRPLYDWLIEHLDIYPSRQIEFSRLNLTYTIMSKRRLLRLVKEGYVTSWDDPRMPTISGIRRRGYPALALRNFADDVGVTKRTQFVDLSRLEDAVRKVLNKTSTRVMAVLNPIKLVIDNLPEDYLESCELVNNPELENSSSHSMAFTQKLFIEREDFMIDPDDNFYRLAVGRFVRLKGAYIIECKSYDLDENGELTAVRCVIVENSKSGQDTSGVKSKGVLHWVSASEYVDIAVRNYDRMFNEEFPTKHEDSDFVEFYNKASLVEKNMVKAEKFITTATEDTHFQFLRQGYYFMDKDSTTEKMIFNRTASLKDNWQKKTNKNG